MKNRLGFTLAELMTVISVMVLMSGFGLSSLSASRSRARDNRRVVDLKLIQQSLELYRIDLDSSGNTNNLPAYPVKIYNEPTFNKYLTSVPVDPTGQKAYIYYAPACLHPGGGDSSNPTIVSPTKGDLNFHTKNEIEGQPPATAYCPVGGGWMPYVIYGLLERPLAGESAKNSLVNLAKSERALVYSITQPIYRQGEGNGNSWAIYYNPNEPNRSSVCYPTIASCPTGYDR